MKCNYIDIKWATWLCKCDVRGVKPKPYFNIKLLQKGVCACVRKSRLGWDGSLHSEALTMPPFHSWPRSQGPARLMPLPAGSALPLTGSLRLLPALLGLRGRGGAGQGGGLDGRVLVHH